jgi:hypothetical protein
MTRPSACRRGAAEDVVAHLYLLAATPLVRGGGDLPRVVE